MVKPSQHYREPFDGGREFVVARPLQVQGRKLGPKDEFNKNLVSTRRLRQLYDQRVLNMTPVKEKKSTRYRPKRDLTDA